MKFVERDSGVAVVLVVVVHTRAEIVRVVRIVLVVRHNYLVLNFSLKKAESTCPFSSNDDALSYFLLDLRLSL